MTATSSYLSVVERLRDRLEDGMVLCCSYLTLMAFVLTFFVYVTLAILRASWSTAVCPPVGPLKNLRLNTEDCGL